MESECDIQYARSGRRTGRTTLAASAQYELPHLNLLFSDLNIQERGKLVYITADYEKLRSDISQLSEDTNGYIQQKKQEVTQLMAVRQSVSLVVPFSPLLACTEMRGVG